MRLPRSILVSELVGTAALLAVGLSVVIFLFGAGSPAAQWLPSQGLRRALAGLLFGTTGALIAVSPVGRHSGAHINPAVTLAFWLLDKLPGTLAAGYVAAQLAGAVLGCLPLLAWGAMGRGLAFAATVPGPRFGDLAALGGETLTTFAMVTGLFYFLRRERLRPYTPLLFPPLYAFMVWLEAPVSGTSTNPARTLGPAVISGAWGGWWVYWVGPLAGAALAAALYRSRRLKTLEVEVAKLYHFEHDPHGVFRAPAGGGALHGQGPETLL
ncbi:MAG: aquaporin [Elusimicrobia bacterium]|nr:aquaporin [Elusimicrobiota bacterium]